MNHMHMRGNLNLSLLSSLILVAIAAVGWYNYLTEEEMLQDSITSLSQKEQELRGNLAAEKKSQEQLQAAFEAIKAEKVQIEISLKQELSQTLEQQKIRVDQLTQTEQELQATLKSEKESQEQLRASLEAIKAEKVQMEISLQQELSQTLEQQKIRVDQLTQAEQDLQANLASEKETQEQLRASLEAIKAEKEQMEISLLQEVNRVASTTVELEKELERRQSQQNSLEEKINTVSGEKSQLTLRLEQEQRKRRQLQQKIDNVFDDVVQKEEALADAELGVSQLNQQLETTRQERALLEVHVKELSQQRKKDSDHFAKLRNRLEQELNESQVEIAQLKNQMTVIKLTDDVLFSTGSARIKPAGKKVLSLIAESLNAYPGRAINIEGHTDNVPIGNSSRYASNWELSSMRALAALNYFQHNSLVDPKRLKLVGYGEFRPAFSNSTAEGRQRNRRIEIVILPP